MNHLNNIGEQALAACKSLLQEYKSGTKYNFNEKDCPLCEIGGMIETCSFCPWVIIFESQCINVVNDFFGKNDWDPKNKQWKRKRIREIRNWIKMIEDANRCPQIYLE